MSKRRYTNMVALLPVIEKMLAAGMSHREIETELGLEGVWPVHNLLKLLFVGAGLDVRSVDKDRAGIYHAVIQCIVENVLIDFPCQFLRKLFAEGITHRGKMGVK